MEERQISLRKDRFDSLSHLDKTLLGKTLSEQIIKMSEMVYAGYAVFFHEVMKPSSQKFFLDETGKKYTFRQIKALFPSKKVLEELLESETLEKKLTDGIPLYSALAIDSSTVKGMYFIADDLLTRGEKDKARDLFALLVFLAPHVIDFWVGYGGSLVQLGNFAVAEDVLQKALYVDPHSSTAVLLLCRVFVHNNRRPEAEARIGAKIDEAARCGDQEAYALYTQARIELTYFHPE